MTYVNSEDVQWALVVCLCGENVRYGCADGAIMSSCAVSRHCEPVTQLSCLMRHGHAWASFFRFRASEIRVQCATTDHAEELVSILYLYSDQSDYFMQHATSTSISRHKQAGQRETKRSLGGLSHSSGSATGVEFDARTANGLARRRDDEQRTIHYRSNATAAQRIPFLCGS